MKQILITGGAGYIGSHTVIELLDSGYRPVIVDDLSNSNRVVLDRITAITGQDVPFHQFDIRDTAALDTLFDSYAFDSVIHFAGLKSVGESVSQPLHYYQTNIGSTLSLCEAMRRHKVYNLLFSSSATVYGTASERPLKETTATGIGITNPYGQTKFMIEQILSDIAKADPAWHITLLRYFNPVGAHESGLIGEDPNGRPNNLLPYVSQVAVGKLPEVHIYGNDYDTPDGTGVRDYIHVVDLAKGHVAALHKLTSLARPHDIQIYNLGTGTGVSVLEMISAFEVAAGKPIPSVIDPRRPGDIASCFADVTKASQLLGWKAQKTIQQACQDAWHWQSGNPNGYK